MIEDAFDPTEELRLYEEETERESNRVNEQDELSRYLFGTQFDRLFPRYIASHGAEHALDLIGMRDIIAYVKERSAEVVEKIESDARQTIDKLKREERRLSEKNIHDADELFINEFMAGDYKRVIDTLHEKAVSPNQNLSAEEWKNLVERLYTRLENDRKTNLEEIGLEHTRIEAEEREFYLENWFPSKWL